MPEQTPRNLIVYGHILPVLRRARPFQATNSSNTLKNIHSCSKSILDWALIRTIAFKGMKYSLPRYCEGTHNLISSLELLYLGTDFFDSPCELVTGED